LRVRHKLPGGGFVILGLGGVAWVEASLPMRVWGRNWEGLALPESLEALREVVREAEALCEPDRSRGGHQFERHKVTRLDLVRDFDGVLHLSLLLDGLARVPRRGRTRVRHESSFGRFEGSSLRIGPRAWAGVLYDKHAETRGGVPPGRVRFEARIRAGPLRGRWAAENGGPVRAVGDINEERLQMLRRAIFDRAGFEREVASVTAVERAILTDSTLSPQQRYGLWSYVTAPGLAKAMSPNTARKYRTLAVGMGIVPGRLEDSLTPREAVRLDYQGGTAEVRAA
jgi:hypothetical protein